MTDCFRGIYVRKRSLRGSAVLSLGSPAERWRSAWAVFRNHSCCAHALALTKQQIACDNHHDMSATLQVWDSDLSVQCRLSGTWEGLSMTITWRGESDYFSGFCCIDTVQIRWFKDKKIESPCHYSSRSSNYLALGDQAHKFKIKQTCQDLSKREKGRHHDSVCQGDQLRHGVCCLCGGERGREGKGGKEEMTLIQVWTDMPV